MNTSEGMARLKIVGAVGLCSVWALGLLGVLASSYVLKNLIYPSTFILWIVLWFIGGMIALHATSSEKSLFSKISFFVLSLILCGVTFLSIIGVVEGDVETSQPADVILVLFALLFWYAVIFGILVVIRWIAKGFISTNQKYTPPIAQRSKSSNQSETEFLRRPCHICGSLQKTKVESLYYCTDCNALLGKP